eukprot:363065-Chlamydomonas_euryale.AAC.1
MKAAIVDAKDLRDELKAADARLRTKPTGIRPRDLMLPVRCWRGVAVTDPGGSPRNVFVLALLAVPILAIILPVFIKAGADKEILADGKLYACALSEIPRQVSAAWGSQNRRGNLPFDAITYAKSQRPKNTASRVVKEYLARHKQQCELGMFVVSHIISTALQLAMFVDKPVPNSGCGITVGRSPSNTLNRVDPEWLDGRVWTSDASEGSNPVRTV